MTAGVRIWVAWAALLMVGVNGQSDGSFWWLNNATTVTPNTDISCQCVPYYQCVDGVITTSGVGLIDVRINTGNNSQPVVNVENCPELLDVCCKLPPDTDSATTAPTTTTTLPPDTPCDCVPLLECKDPNRLVSDGKGDTSLALFGGSFSHSKCQGAFTVCCASEHTAAALEESGCVCVAENLCGDDGRVITDGSGLINIRLGPGSTPSSPDASGSCRNPSDVCCLPPPDVTATTTAPPTTTATSTAAPLPGCGWRNVGGVRVRVLGFKEGESQFGEFPWVAAILKPTPGASTLQFVGGGTLIHPRVVLTAAHKVYSESKDELVVRLGEWDTQGETEPYLHKDVKVSNVIIHGDFNPTTLYNDVALLFLEEEVELKSHINTICLAEDLSQVDWSRCVINGWGVNAFGTTQYQQIMKSLELPLVDSNTCQGRLRTTRLGSFFNLHQSFVCAGGEAGKDACKGDGGGPLACPQLSQPTGHYLLVGLTAWGVGCGQEGLPGVYVNIPDMHSWITTNLDQYLSSGGSQTGHQVVADEGETQQGGQGGGGGRGERRQMNQERREQRQREREERQREREERRRQREQRRQERRQNANGRK